ncbi:Alpha-amylase 3 protein, partial [Thalictrum thalictroides]
MGYVKNNFHDDSQETGQGAVLRNGKEILLQAFNWESHKHEWWRNLEGKVPDIAESGFTSAWLPPATDSFAPEDHTQSFVRKDIIQWLFWLCNNVGFQDFRFDFARGYAPKYVKEYIEGSKPIFSVGEYWDSCNYSGTKLEYNQ